LSRDYSSRNQTLLSSQEMSHLNSQLSNTFVHLLLSLLNSDNLLKFPIVISVSHSHFLVRLGKSQESAHIFSHELTERG
jgi:hypothetical protein